MTHDITITLDFSLSEDNVDFYIQPDVFISSGNLVINWGDNTSETISPHETIEHTYQYGNIYTITIDGVSDIGDGFLSTNIDYTNGNITEVTLSSNITTIGDDFCIGTHITEMIIPNSITSIGNNFCNGTDITEIVIPENVTSIGEFFCADSALNAIHIPSNVTTIDKCFCYMCSNLRAVSFSTGLTEVGEDFVGKTLVSRLEFPEGLSISGGFYDAPNINTIIYPSSIDDIGMLVFENGYFDPQKIVFKSRTPPYINYYWENFNGIIYVPEGCIDNYIEYATESGALLEDPNYYKENLTLPRALDKFGTLMRTNLGRKGIETNINDGLTTLSEKVNDIELWEEPTGFFADMGLYNLENWSSSGQPPTFIDDKIILNEGATFVFPSDYEFPDTFTAACVISSLNTTDYIDWGNVSVRYNELGCSGEGNFKQLVILKRNNGGDFEIEILPSYDGWTVSTPQDYINFYLSNSSTMTISNLYYTNTYYNGSHDDDYTLYDVLTYSIIWDDNYNISNTRPEKLPAFLLQNNNISEYYDISANYAGNYTIPYNENGDEWGCWAYQHPNNENEYVWKNIDDFKNTDDYLQHYYSCVKGSGQERIDRYILGLAKSWSSFEDNETFFDNESLEPFWEIGFDYTFDGASNDNKDAYVQIGPDNECIQCGVINGSNAFNIVGHGDSFVTSYLTSMHCKFGIHEMHTKNGRFYITYYVEINGDKRFHSDSILQNNMNKICPFDLYKVVQHSNAKITNLYYKNNNVALWDSCKKNPINGLYGSSVPFFGNSSNTLTYSNDEYILQGSGNYFSGRRIQVLDGVNNGLVRVKFKLNGQRNNPAFNQLFICCTDETPSSTETTYPYATRVRDDKLFQYFQFTSESTIYTHNTTYSSDWFYLEATKEGQYWTMKLYDETFSLLAESTEHIQSTLDNPNWYIGTQTEMGTNYSVHIQEIYAEKLLYLDS